jgi:photosystem II stability/assembly factor-like uncharacterized protein
MKPFHSLNLSKKIKRSVSLFWLIIPLLLCAGSYADDFSHYSNYLVKVGIGPGFRLERLEGTGFRLLAKDVDFVLGEIAKAELDNLREVGVDFKVLDEDTERGDYYLVYPQNGDLDSKLQASLESVKILDVENNVATVRASPAAAESLPLKGLFIRKVGRESLPLRSRYVTVLKPVAVTTNPVIEEILSQVTEFSVANFDSGLSGEFEVTIGGEPYTLSTRYSATKGCLQAGQYLKESFEDYGLDVDYHYYFSGYLRGVAVHADGEVAWAVNYFNEILRTTDGGESWHQVENGFGEGLWAVDNAGTDSVWVVGSPGMILASSDGGLSFHQQASGVSGWLYDLFFLDSKRGWVVGGEGVILKTTNGGEDWESLLSGVSVDLQAVVFIDTLKGWACGLGGIIIHTSDGGATWHLQDSHTRSGLYEIQFTDENEGWAVGTEGTICHTANGGERWELQDSGTNSILYGLSFVDPQIGWVVGQDGTILHTTNGGLDWERQNSGVSGHLWEVEFIDSFKGWAVGHNQILKTGDGGGEWRSQKENIEAAWRNVVATEIGSIYPHSEVIICAHYDAVSQIPYLRAPGADDNGSGTAAVEEAARILSQYPFEKTLKFIGFSGEEQGLLGSKAYAEEAYNRGDSIVAVVNLDMIAYDSDNDYAGEIHCGTDSNSISIGELFIELAEEYQLPLVLEKFTSGASRASDHASFWDYGYPAIMGIEDKSDDFNPHLHSTGDNMSIVNASYFAEYVKAALATVATLAVPDTQLVSVEDDSQSELPERFTLMQNYPNPFNTSTVIRFGGQVSEARLEIFDLAGRKVKSFNLTGAIGETQVIWDGTNQTDEQVSSGIYFYRLSSGDSSGAKRMILIR